MKELLQGFKIATGILTRRVLAGPINVQVSIVDACNYRCIMCWEHSSLLEGWGADELARSYHEQKAYKTTTMDFDLYKSFIRSLRETGTRRICFAGIGEPLLHKRIVEAVSFAKGVGMNVRLTTNGSLLEEELMKELFAAGLDDLSVSINAGKRDEYQMVHSNQEDSKFDEIVENLVWLKEYKQKKSITKPDLHLSNVISNVNSHRTVEMMNTGIETGACSVSYRPLDVFAQTEPYALAASDLEILEEAFPEVERIASQHNIETDTATFKELIDLRSKDYIPAPCFAGWLFPMVMANGDVTYCCVSREVLGNLNDATFESIWFASSRRGMNDIALNIHRTQKPVPNSRCFGCERSLQNLRIYRYLWPLWGRASDPVYEPEKA